MRAKTINEIQKFERGKDAKSAVGIGKAKEAYEILEERLNGGSRRAQTVRMYDIEVKSLNEIIITYSAALRKRAEGAKEKTDWDSYRWVIKYSPIVQFEVESYYNEGEFFGHVSRTNQWNIIKKVQSGYSDPRRFSIKNETISHVTKSVEKSEELAKVMVEGLNQHYGELWVFETIEGGEGR